MQHLLPSSLGDKFGRDLICYDPAWNSKLPISKLIRSCNMTSMFVSENLDPGDQVLAKNRSDWIPGVVSQKLGPLTYLIDVGQGRTWRRHIDLLKKIPSDSTSSDFFMPTPVADGNSDDPPTLRAGPSSPPATDSTENATPAAGSGSPPEGAPVLRRSTRARREPDRYRDTYMYT